MADPSDDREPRTVSLYVHNLDCENDAARLQRTLRDADVFDVTIYPKSARLLATISGDDGAEIALRTLLAAHGFPVRDRDVDAGPPKPWRNPKVVTSAVSGLLLAAGWLVSRGGTSDLVTWPIYLTSLASGAFYFGREALDELIHERAVGIELLMLVAALAATALGAPSEGAMLAFLYSMSEAAEGYTEAKTRSAVRALMNLAPRTAVVRRDGVEADVPVELLAIGDVFIVRPGAAVPTDGEIIEGRSSLNQAPVTGESVPVEKESGDRVFAGSINGEGALDVRATTAFAENTISRIVHMVEEAQERKGQSQRFIERFGARYTPAVLLVGALLAIIPPLAFGAPWNPWLGRATVFIVAAAPCALVISIPITLVAALGTGARNGVLIKGGVYVEALARVRVVALDKTGTVTFGTPEVTQVLSVQGSTVLPDIALQRAAAVERRSQHPLAQAIVRRAEMGGTAIPSVADFRSLTGAAAVGSVEGTQVHVGSPAYFERQLGVSLEGQFPAIESLQNEGHTVVIVGTSDAAWALMAIQDTVRPNAASALQKLREVGIERIVMLTGDNARTANAVARNLGFDEVHADLRPEDKARLVRDLAAHGGVAMVGDGVNDAPALAEATVGVAMGAAGTDVALETADVALMADDLDKLVYALSLARRNQRVVRQNIGLSVVVVGVLMIGAVAGVFTLPVAVIAHELSEFAVIASGLRMLRT